MTTLEKLINRTKHIDRYCAEKCLKVTGEEYEVVKDALKRVWPTHPKINSEEIEKGLIWTELLCPCCDEPVEENEPYCDVCGQALDWVVDEYDD